jgi:hypothetical protein
MTCVMQYVSGCARRVALQYQWEAATALAERKCTGAAGKEAKDDGPKLALWAGRHPWRRCLIVDVRGSQPIQLHMARSYIQAIF